MKLWEYYAVTLPKDPQDPTDILVILERYGMNGWELCCVEYGCWIFKREKK